MLTPKPPPPSLLLAKIHAPTAAQFSSNFKPSPAAQACIRPEQTPTEVVRALEENQLPMDAANLLAHEMPEQEAVWWACQSSRQVQSKLNAAELSALDAAECWVKHPSIETQAAAAAAAARTDRTGPGGWAAQAAAWSKPAATPPAASAADVLQQPPGLAGSAVSGAVLLAAGLAQPSRPPMPQVQMPAFALPQITASAPVPSPLSVASLSPPPITAPDPAKLSKVLQPFLELGKQIASGNNSWLGG